MIRLTLLCNAATEATRRGAFPADEPLDMRGARDAAALAGALDRADRVLVSPALRAMQTADALGLSATPEDDLRDLDCGRWAGLSLTEIAESEPDAVAEWLADPDAAPHEGESIAAAMARVGGFLERLGADDGRVLAVTHAAVIRAAIALTIGAPATSFWRIDVAPLGRAMISGDGTLWRLKSLVM